MELQSSHHKYVLIGEELIAAAQNERECKGVGKLLVFHTGGAIGMKLEDGMYKPASCFLANYLHKMPIFNDPGFTTKIEKNEPESQSVQNVTSLPTSTPSIASEIFVMPLTGEKRRILFRVIEYDHLIDSSNSDMEYWINLAKDIEMWYKDFDGFVILQGTDTIAFAASALSFIMENLAKPVILTGSELPICELRCDGRHNLLGALLFAGGGYNIPEVTVYLQNKLYRGNRIVKCATKDFLSLISPNFPPLAESRGDVTIHPERIWKTEDIRTGLRIQPDLCSNVAIVRIFPSISANAVKSYFQPPIQGVILQSFGAGHVPSDNRELIDLFREATEKHKIVILNITQCWKGTVLGIYAVGAILNKVGVVSGYDITPEAALMKMAYVLGKWKDPATRKRMLAHSLRGEMTEPTTEIKKSHDSISKFAGSSSITPGEHIQKLGGLLSEAKNIGLEYFFSKSLFPSMMCAAAEVDDTNTLEQLHRIAGHFEWFDHSHRSPLHLAAGAGAFAACRLMLEYGAHPNNVDKGGYTPMSYAIRSSNSTPALIRLLCRFHGQVSGFVSARAREVNNAARLGQIRQLRLYRLAGLTLQEIDAEGRAALHTAVVYNQVETLRYLISPVLETSSLSHHCEFTEVNNFEVGGAGVDAFQTTGYGTTALEEAKIRKFDEIAQILESFRRK